MVSYSSFTSTSNLAKRISPRQEVLFPLGTAVTLGVNDWDIPRLNCLYLSRSQGLFVHFPPHKYH